MGQKMKLFKEKKAVFFANHNSFYVQALREIATAKPPVTTFFPTLSHPKSGILIVFGVLVLSSSQIVEIEKLLPTLKIQRKKFFPVQQSNNTNNIFFFQLKPNEVVHELN